MQSWQALDGRLHHLLLMMSLDCPLAIRHNKGEYKWLEIGGVFIYLYIFFEIFILEL